MMSWGGYSAIFSRLRATKMWEKYSALFIGIKKCAFSGRNFFNTPFWNSQLVMGRASKSRARAGPEPEG